MCKFPIFPILPTSEGQTMSFLQKLEMLEYKVDQISSAIDSIETSLNNYNIQEELTITDGDGNTGSAALVQLGNVAILKILDASNLTSPTWTLSGFSNLKNIVLSLTAAAVGYSYQGTTLYGVEGRAYISKNYGETGGVFTLGIAGKVIRTTNGMPAAVTATIDDYKRLVGYPITFYISGVI